MMHRRGLLTLLAGSIGGCLRLTGGSGPTATPAEGPTVTPAAVTTDPADTPGETEGDAPTPSPESDLEFPTGLGPDGVEPFLVDNHVNTLAGTPYTEVFQSTLVTTGDSMVNQTTQIGDGIALTTWGDGSGIEMVSTSETQYWRQDLGDRVSYGENRWRFDFTMLCRARQLQRLFLAGAWNAPEPNDAEGYFTVTADEAGDPRGLRQDHRLGGPEVGGLEEFSGEARVLENGVIRELLVEYQYLSTAEDRLFKVAVRHAVEDVGQVSVEEPPWLATAQEQAPTVEATITDDQQFLRFEHQDGNPIEPGTNVVLYDREAERNWGYRDTDEPIEAGTTMFLWMENDEFQWTRGSRPIDANPQSLDGRYGFWMHRHGAEYFGDINFS